MSTFQLVHGMMGSPTTGSTAVLLWPTFGLRLSAAYAMASDESWATGLDREIRELAAVELMR